jgi:hypothetical protein
MADRRRLLWPAAVAAISLAVAFVVNWPALAYPYVQEDWEVLGAFGPSPAGRAIADAFASTRGIHYRPLVTVYLIVLHKLFGLDGLPSHALVIVFLAASAVAIWALVRELTGDARLGVLVAVTHAAANVIHIDTLMIQTCGVENQVGATCFFFATLALLRRRAATSALLYAIGVLVKETVVILPAFMVLCAAIAPGGDGRLFATDARLRARLQAAARRLWPHAIVLAAFLAVKHAGRSPFRVPASDPYFMSLFGVHLFTNFATYVRWTLEVLVPGVRPWPAAAIAAAVGLAALASARPFDAARRRVLARWGAFFATWYGLALGPMLILPNHTYRYYALFALPAALCVWWAALRQLLGVLVDVLLGGRDAAVRAARRELAAAVVALALVVQAAASFAARERAGEDLDGANATLARAYTVFRVWPFLAAAQLPPGATILFDGLEVWSFGKDAGPRLWRGDPRLEVYSAANLRWSDAGAPEIVDAATHQGELYTGAHNHDALDPAKTFVIRDAGGQLVLEPVMAHAGH